MGTNVDGPLIAGALLRELNGEVIEATAIYHVSENTAPILENALATSGIPQPGDSLNSTNTNVKVTERSAHIVGWGGVVARVRCEIRYELLRPTTSTDGLRGGATLNSVKTQKDRLGNNITVSYNGNTVIAEPDVLVAQGTFVRERIETTDNPETIVATYINKVNDASFRGHTAGEWLCTNISYSLAKRGSGSTHDFLFTYEFERRPINNAQNGWTYTVVWKNSDGTIPDDIVEGVGIKDIDWHEEADFSGFE